VLEAARRGIFAYITDGEPQEWQNSIEIVLRRFAEFRDLEGAFKRRTITERAKGILMERHSVDEERAFQMLRDHARRTQSMLVDAAQSIIDGTLSTQEP
jgi:response regulator NasT